MKDIYAAFIFVSAFTYFAGVALVILGHPPIMNVNLIVQAIAFAFMGFFSLTALSNYEGHPLLTSIRVVLVVMWGIMAAFTFTGFIRWAPDGSAPYQLFMTAWDLALAVCVMDEG